MYGCKVYLKKYKYFFGIFYLMWIVLFLAVIIHQYKKVIINTFMTSNGFII